nr:immunoglobulin heavy chain junction region [Macaca mulatta]
CARVSIPPAFRRNRLDVW